MSSALELSHISKRFGSVVALDDVSLVVRPGTVHALLGENGAGKTTLMHVAYGLTRGDAGMLRVGGRDTRIAAPLDAIAAGIGMVHQHFTLVPAMTVWENLALGAGGSLEASTVRNRVAEVAAGTGFALDPDALVEALPVGAQQRVEIAKALARNASILILDEPTAVLAPPEVEDLLTWLRGYVEAGNSAVLITHKLREAFRVADDITVLRRGRVALSTQVASTTPADVSSTMIGAAIGDPAGPVSAMLGAVVFEAECLSVSHGDGRVAVRDASFSVRAGELIGIAGVEGSGQRELLRALAGRTGAASGTLRRPERVGFIPEDRHADAVLLDRSLAENVALRDVGERTGTMSWSAVRSKTATLVEAFDIRGGGAGASMRSLSGGNQQKLVVAREMAGSNALVVENPTRGLDVRATAEVHRRLREACAHGAAIVMYSSDVDEVLALASRVLVVHGGGVREVPNDRDAVGRAMVGLP